MSKKARHANIYKLPIRFFVKYHLMNKIAILYFNFCIVGIYYLFLFYKPISKQDLEPELMLMAAIILIFTYLVLILDIDFIHSAILHKQYIEVNRDEIMIKKLFKKMFLEWNDIYLVDLYTFRMSKVIRITRFKYGNLNKYLIFIGKAFGLFYVGINVRKYSNIDIGKFMNTVKAYI